MIKHAELNVLTLEKELLVNYIWELGFVKVKVNIKILIWWEKIYWDDFAY